MGSFLSKIGAFWGKFIANPLTLWGAILPVFLGFSAFLAHAENPDAGLRDDLYSFYQGPLEDPGAVMEGAGLFLGDAFTAAAAGLTDFVFPGFSFVAKAIFNAVSSDEVVETASNLTTSVTDFMLG